MVDVPCRQDRMGPQILWSTSLDQMWAENQEGHSPTQGHMVNYQKSGTGTRLLIPSPSRCACHTHVTCLTLSFR